MALRDSGRYSRLIFILIDGATHEALTSLIASGDLPNFAALAEAGGGVKKAVTCFPSTSGPAYIPYYMGLFPGTANVPGYRWMSRAGYNDAGSRWTTPGIASYSGREALGFNDHLPAEHATWFDYFGSSKSIFNLLTRGVHPGGDMTKRVKPIVYTIGHYLHQWRLADSIAARSLVRAVESGVEFIACTFQGVDGHSHADHSLAPKVVRSYRTIDRAIGEARSLLRRTGRDEQTLWVIGSDHGHSATSKHIDLAREMDGLGFPTLYYPRLWRQDAHCAEMVSGNGMSQLYFRNGQNWAERMPWEEIEARDVPNALLSLDGVDLVAGQSSDGATHVRGRRGEGTIVWAQGKCSYSFRHDDPLGCGGFEGRSADETLDMSFGSEYPDAYLQLTQLFRAERSGDLIVTAKQGFDLRARWEIPEHHSTHGSLIPAQMHVPVIISHPIERDHFRTADVFPTVLDLLGHTPEPGLDGVARA